MRNIVTTNPGISKIAEAYNIRTNVSPNSETLAIIGECASQFLDSGIKVLTDFEGVDFIASLLSN